MEEILALYEAYMEEFHKLERVKNPWDGALGLGKGSAGYPCHDEFIQNLDALITRISTKKLTSIEATDILTYIYFTAPNKWSQEKAPYLMMLAAHGLTLGLANILGSNEAALFYKKYNCAYPRQERLPVQNEVLKTLKNKQ